MSDVTSMRVGLLAAMCLSLFVSLPSAADEPSPVVLTPIVTHPWTYATSRHRLSTGAYVQMTSGCSEWAGGGSGFFLWWDVAFDDWSYVMFPSGPFFETSRHLIVEAREQVGSDGVGEPPSLPEGCRYTIYESNGSIFCTEVLAIDLTDGTIRSAGYDTFAPISAGAGRFVALSVAGTEQTPHRHVYGREAREWRVWDLETDRSTPLGELGERPHARASATEVFIRLGETPDFEYRAIDGTTGVVRSVTADEAAIPDRSYRLELPRRGTQTSHVEPIWLTTDGRAVVVEPYDSTGDYEPPWTGGCGLDGPYVGDGLLFVDHGVYRWPAGLVLETR